MAAPKKPAKKEDAPIDLLGDLEKALSAEMTKLESDPEATLTDKTKIYDRVLKLCQIKLKIDDAGEGDGFFDY